MKSQVLHAVWCNISGEAAREIWNWSLLGIEGFSSLKLKATGYKKRCLDNVRNQVKNVYVFLTSLQLCPFLTWLNFLPFLPKFYCFRRFYNYRRATVIISIKMMSTFWQQPKYKANEVEREARRLRDHGRIYTQSSAPARSKSWTTRCKLLYDCLTHTSRTM